MAVESQSGRWTWRGVIGWSAVALNLLVSCFWAFWGAIENFHEGWHYGHVGLNLLWTLAYLHRMLAAVLLGLLALRWPRLPTFHLAEHTSRCHRMTLTGWRR